MGELELPTELHRQIIEIIRDFFLRQNHIDTILLTNSCARGKAVQQSDIDFAILVKQATQPKDIEELENKWNSFQHAEPALAKYKNSHLHAQIHLDIINGVYEPSTWDDGGGPDFFEVEIGNHLVYSRPLAGNGDYCNRLRENWLPYYSDTLQTKRLKMVINSCAYDLDHIPFLVKRGLYFHAFDRLYKSFQEFLQALFIKNKTYPIAYNKWIREQFDEIIFMPELYKELPAILSVMNIESDEISTKAQIVAGLLAQYC
jgi:predicted nucleotidyltransferase